MENVQYDHMECLENLVLFPMVAFVEEMGEEEDIPDRAKQGVISRLSLWELRDAKKRVYKHVPNLDGKEYVIDMAKGNGRMTVKWIDGERTIDDYAAVYEVHAVSAANDERVELSVKKVENIVEKERVCTEVTNRYFGKTVYYTGIPFEFIKK